MDPQAFALDISDPVAIAYTVPIPVAILIVAVGTIWLRFKNFDPVAVVERRIV
jgi:putative ABC transport system permease protein/lipoprotein-releasing system permease protein